MTNLGCLAAIRAVVPMTGRFRTGTCEPFGLLGGLVAHGRSPVITLDTFKDGKGFLGTEDTPHAT